MTIDPDQAASEADQYMAALNERAIKLQSTGISRSVAFCTAEVETRIARYWPEVWGNDLQALIYGDFDAPEHDLDYPTLGITVEAGKRTNTIIRTALCVVNARVKVPEKSLPAVLDAAGRLNTLLGIWTIIDWGNRGVGWWCSLTSGTMGGVGGPFKKEGIEDALAGIERLPPKVRRKIRAALYWIRVPKQMMQEGFRSDILQVYAGYWNAFESLVEAICLISPQNKMKKKEKQDGITEFVANHQGKLDVASLRQCYRLYVDSGFVAKASHALRVCCPD